MSKKIKKLAYCSHCCKNIPHFVRMSGIFQRTFGGLLQNFRIGPWCCLHCQRERMILPAVREGAPEYLRVRSNSPVDSNKPEIWSLSCSAVPEPSESCEAVVGGGFDEDHEDRNSLDHSHANGNGSLDGTPPITDESQGQYRSEVRSEVSKVVDEQPDYVDVSNWSHSFTLKEPTGDDSTVSDLQSEREGQFESDEVLEAEPVGNFIKDQSLVLKSNRMHRFTEKFRDSVVNRILAGKVSISSLTENGQYCESELVSWIADKAKRQEEIETLELDTGSGWGEQRRTDGFGPSAPR